MGKTRIVNLAKELKMEVRELIQRLKDDMGLQENFTYLSSLDEATVARARQVISTATPQVEELRVGDNVKRRRRVAPPPVTPIEPPPESVPEAEAAPPPPKEAAKPRKPKETVARVVSLPPKGKAAAAKTPPPVSAQEPPVTEAALPEVTPEPPEAAPAEPAVAAADVPPTAPPAASPKTTAAADSATALKRQRGKAKKKEVPARIISLPPEKPPAPPAPAPAAHPVEAGRTASRPGARNAGARASASAPGARPSAGPAKPPVVEEKKDIKGKKKVKRPEVPDAARAKPVKKREVRERADLYSGAEGEHRGSGRRKGMKKGIKKLTKGELTVPKAIKRRVKVGESITVGELAKRMGIKSGAIIKQLMQMGVIANINYPIDFDSATIVAGEFGYEVEHASMQEEDLLAVAPRQSGEAKLRPPVVTIMGHVDHGKTSLLDAIRRTRVTEGEAGGITQHIGAYYVELPEKQGEVVFLDTPGHEAFTAMRARGAKVTDLVVLVVAADDGVMEAEILDLKAYAEVPASGRIIESRLDKGRGPVGTVLVQEGTLKPGDYFVCGPQYGRVRALFDDRGEKVDEVPPGLPAEVQGFNGVPEAGDEFLVLEDERKAKQIAMMRQQKLREATMARISRVTLEKLYQQVRDGAVKELKMVLKADVHGSIEALAKALSELGTKDIKVSMIHAGLGEVSENDIMLASASDAIVVGFNVRANPKAIALAEQEQVDVRYYDIIYNLLQDIHAALEGLLEPIVEEKVMGRAEVRQVFSITKVGTIAGCMVLDGKIERNSLARVVRKGKVVSEGGKINSLKRFKDDVKEVQSGYECGIGIDRFNDYKAGDIIEAYTQEKVKAILAAPTARLENATEAAQ
jgi:translation initiation factor IF-2